MADSGHLKNRKITMSKTVWPILLKFCTITYVNQCQSEFFSVAKIAELLQSPHGRNILAESQYDIRE